MNKLKRFQDLSLYLRNTVKHSLLQVSSDFFHKLEIHIVVQTCDATKWHCWRSGSPDHGSSNRTTRFFSLFILFLLFSYSFDLFRSLSYEHNGWWWAMGVQNCCAVTLWLPRASTFGVLLRWSGCHIALDWGGSFAGPDTKIQTDSENSPGASSGASWISFGFQSVLSDLSGSVSDFSRKWSQASNRNSPKDTLTPCRRIKQNLSASLASQANYTRSLIRYWLPLHRKWMQQINAILILRRIMENPGGAVSGPTPSRPRYKRTSASRTL